MTVSRRKFLLATGAGALAAPGLGGLVLGTDGVEVDSVRGDSLWTTQIPEIPRQPRFEGDRKADLVIVGGGYTGLACAYYAKQLRPDWSVIVLESHAIGSGASSRNSGAVSARQVGIDDPGLPQRGLNRLRHFMEAEEIECDFRASSTLMMETSGSGVPELSADEKWIAADELREAIGSDYYTGAIDQPGYFKVQPAKLVAGHARAALRVGAELFEHSPALSIEEGTPVRVHTPHGTLVAVQVMIATNAYTPRLGLFESVMYPIHQYSLATRKLTSTEISELALDRWSLRFERRLLPVTFSLTASGHFFMRMVLGYASFNSCDWQDIAGAEKLALRLFRQRYPQVAELGPTYGWHGVTGHTTLMRPVAGTFGDGNIHISAAYNGSGIMPAHNSGYLMASRICGQEDADTGILTDASTKLPIPGDFYRSMILKPGMWLMTPV